MILRMPWARAFVFVTTCILLSCSAGFAQDAATSMCAPSNPAFVKYLAGAMSGGVEIQSIADGHPLGLVPAPVDLSHMRGQRILLRTSSILSLPASYDLRTASPARLTAVRDQGGCGSCWAFATYGSLESGLMPTLPSDFSENNLKNTHGFDWACCDGGNHYLSAAYLARWAGPVLESSDPYSMSCTSPTGLQPARHVQNVDFLPDRSGSLDNDNIKQSVMNNGALYTSMYWSDSSYNYSTKAYYHIGSATSNHAVCIVGWNDNYAKSNFTPAPTGDGAFIVRNSWGSGWGESGYFYISYYDSNVGKDNASFNNADATANYNHIYQYDPLGWANSLGFGSQTAWFANVFRATLAGQLRAVSFYTASPNSSYEVYVYLDPTTGPLSSTGSAGSAMGSMPNAGYHTVLLPAPVSVTADHKFSVVVKLTTPGYTYPVPFESPYAGYSSTATSNLGESFISADGGVWTDIYDRYANANVCLKAFVSDQGGLSVTPSSDLMPDGAGGGPFSPSSQTYTLLNTSSTGLNWTASKTATWVNLSASSGALPSGATAYVTVSINSAANALAAGLYADVVTFTAAGGGTMTRNVVLNVLNNYEIKSSGFNWITPASQSVFMLSDDGFTPAQTLPFTFGLYGKTYSQIYIASNGMLGFTSDNLGAYANTDISKLDTPNATLYPYWDDLNPAATGSVRMGTVGTAPNRKVVVSWMGVPHYSSPSSPFTFQVVLCEGSNDVLFQYLDVRPSDNGYGAGRSATVGMENDKGTVATKYSYNGKVLVANKQALLFTSRGPTICDVKKQANAASVSIRRAIVTAVFGDAFYIEADDRSSALMVVKPGHGLAPAGRADVVGLLKTTSDGERYIEATAVAQSGSGTVSPICLPTKALGGSDYYFNSSLGTGQRGVSSWHWVRQGGQLTWTASDYGGANNIGLLVRTLGKVSWVGADCFYIDDGSSMADDSGHVGVKVYAPGITAPSLGSIVEVRGISSCYKSGNYLYRMLRAVVK